MYFSRIFVVRREEEVYGGGGRRWGPNGGNGCRRRAAEDAGGGGRWRQRGVQVLRFSFIEAPFLGVICLLSDGQNTPTIFFILRTSRYRIVLGACRNSFFVFLEYF